MVDFKKFSDIDLYMVIGVEITATEAEVSKQIKISRIKLLMSQIIEILDTKIISQKSSGMSS